jgi:hypothetical protein
VAEAHLLARVVRLPCIDSAALQWRSVNVVSEAWAHASLQLGYPAPEEQYKVPPKPAEG